MMKILIAYLMLTVTCMATPAAETTFADILTRVTRRHPTTQAIQSIDKGLRFKLEVRGDGADVTIWKHLKVRDPNRETYTFAISDVIKQEHARLGFQRELDGLIARSKSSEGSYRISEYKKHPLHAGMPYTEAKQLLKDDFHPDGLPRAEEGAHQLESETHTAVFRHGLLIDMITKKTSNQKVDPIN
jgi:hypothetical protein